MSNTATRVLVLVALLCGVHGARAQEATVAVVNGQAITREDVAREDARPDSAKMVFDGKSKKDSLTSLVARALFAQAAVQNGAARLPLVEAEIKKALPHPSDKVVLLGTAAAAEPMSPEEKANFAAAEQVLSQLYIDMKLYEGSKIEDADIHDFYEQSPTLFSKRRVYTFQELTVEDSSPQVMGWVRANFKAVGSVQAVTDYLSRHKIKFHSRVVVRSAEELPMKALDTFAAMRNGDVIVSKLGDGSRFIAVQVQAVKDAPLGEAEVAEMIRRYLYNQRRQALMATEYGLLKLKGSVTLTP